MMEGISEGLGGTLGSLKESRHEVLGCLRVELTSFKVSL